MFNVQNMNSFLVSVGDMTAPGHRFICHHSTGVMTPLPATAYKADAWEFRSLSIDLETPQHTYC